MYSCKYVRTWQYVTGDKSLTSCGPSCQAGVELQPPPLLFCNQQNRPTDKAAALNWTLFGFYLSLGQLGESY